MKLFRLGLLLLFPLTAFAQNPIPPGTILPVRLDSTLNAGHIRPDQPIRARVMQNIPGTPIRRGAQLVGLVLSVHPNSIDLRFNSVVSHGRRIPVSTGLRALASMLDVEQAQLPLAPPARGDIPENENTRQIGGDIVYRGGGPVMAHGVRVGVPTPYGVRVRLTANGPCRSTIDGDTRLQSLWLFSSAACGVYGIPGLAIAHAGRNHPSGDIDLRSTSGRFLIRSGSGWLLRVLGS